MSPKSRTPIVLAALLVAAAATAAGLPAASGRRAMVGSFASEALGERVDYAIHLPPPGTIPDRDLPILYFLHGFRDDEEMWEREGLADLAAAMVERGEIPPMAVALADGGHGMYTNAYAGGPRREDALFPDFVDFAETKLLGRRSRSQRAIAGISMGGYGALKIALKNPGSFCAAASVSGSLMKRPSYGGRFSLRRLLMRRIFGPGDLDTSALNNVHKIAARVRPAEAPALMLACGDADRYGFCAGARELADELDLRGVPAALSVTPGGHDYAYWRKAMPDVLRFVARSLAASATQPTLLAEATGPGAPRLP